ncbi:hypothetical protein [Streptomyces oceani]|uniref:Uncharacterized protein n=1 Tax=Streptomyces oceani TaxID=1075402 RepID=A0A1E7JZA1_9ACTN|nr:hypothetical protein [Streptomyces oceani]OEU96926.1 hypothetical protein AN216_18440 [Streptomyces oceani]
MTRSSGRRGGPDLLTDVELTEQRRSNLRWMYVSCGGLLVLVLTCAVLFGYALHEATESGEDLVDGRGGREEPFTGPGTAEYEDDFTIEVSAPKRVRSEDGDADVRTYEFRVTYANEDNEAAYTEQVRGRIQGVVGTYRGSSVPSDSDLASVAPASVDADIPEKIADGESFEEPVRVRVPAGTREVTLFYSAPGPQDFAYWHFTLPR